MFRQILTPDNRQGTRPILVWLYVVFLVSLATWAYGPALDAPFVFDDQGNIVDSPAVHWAEFSLENVKKVLGYQRLPQRPIANFSFALDHLLWGLEPRGYHLTNILIHAAVCAALFWLSLLYVRISSRSARTEQSPWVTFLIAIIPAGLFLLHPLNTQAVTYVVQRMTSLSTLFTLIAFASYLVARHRLTPRPLLWFCIAIFMWIIGLGCKEIALLLLPVIALYEICFFHRAWVSRIEHGLAVNWNQYWTMGAWTGSFAVAGISLWFVMVSSQSIGLIGDFPGRDFSGIERLMTQARVQIFYLSQLIWPIPSRLNIDHEFLVSTSLVSPPTTLPAIILCMALITVAAYLCSRVPRYGFPLMAYALFHSIEAGPVNLEIIFEHRMYLPMSMLMLAAAVVIADVRPTRRPVILVSAVALSVILAGWTHARNAVWADPLEFQRHIAEKSPGKARTQHNFAVALHEAGRNEEALPVIRHAVDLDRGDPRSLKVLGDVLMDLGMLAEATEAYQTAITMDPTDIRFMLGLGTVMLASGDENAAFLHYLGSGVRLGRNGHPWEAVAILKEAVGVRPEAANARSALGSAYNAAGLNDEAFEQFRVAIELDPELIAAWYNLGLVADALGHTDEALRAYTGFVERAPYELQRPIETARKRIEQLSMEPE
jgi:tetratricopeptide (TPR) repeat protein